MATNIICLVWVIEQPTAPERWCTFAFVFNVFLEFLTSKMITFVLKINQWIKIYLFHVLQMLFYCFNFLNDFLDKYLSDFD